MNVTASVPPDRLIRAMAQRGCNVTGAVTRKACNRLGQRFGENMLDEGRFMREVAGQSNTQGHASGVHDEGQCWEVMCEVRNMFLTMVRDY